MTMPPDEGGKEGDPPDSPPVAQQQQVFGNGAISQGTIQMDNATPSLSTPTKAHVDAEEENKNQNSTELPGAYNFDTFLIFKNYSCRI